MSKFIDVGPHQACKEQLTFICLFGTLGWKKNTDIQSQVLSNDCFKWSVNKTLNQILERDTAQASLRQNIISLSCMESIASQNDFMVDWTEELLHAVDSQYLL